MVAFTATDPGIEAGPSTTWSKQMKMAVAPKRPRET
jgi:hypothetical protein